MRTYALLTLLLVATTPSSVLVADEPHIGIVGSRINGGPRVRTADPRILSALAEGIARSATFRSVLQQVESQDVIVYIEMQHYLRGRLSGALRWVTATKDFRYVRVAINPELSGGLLVAALGHELQHVSEVGHARSIVDTETLRTFYRGAGTPSRNNSDDQWETEAARRTGEIVRREVTSPARVAESIQPAVGEVPALAQRR